MYNVIHQMLCDSYDVEVESFDTLEEAKEYLKEQVMEFCEDSGLDYTKDTDDNDVVFADAVEQGYVYLTEFSYKIE